MEKLLVASLLLGMFHMCATSDLANHPDYSRPLAIISRDRNCVNDEMSCGANCTSVTYCLNGILIETEKCSTGNVCNYANFTCIPGRACGINPSALNFTCHAIGFFPDPFNCSKYHICPTTEQPSFPQECPSSTAYDPLTFQCTKTVNDRVCIEKPIPTCTIYLQHGAQQENPNIYYVCTKQDGFLIPSLSKCGPGEVFQSSDCVSTGTSTSATTSGPTVTDGGSSSSSSTTSTVTTTVGSSTTTQYTCTEEGQFADPSDPTCRGYFVCLPNLVAYRKSCSVNYHYDSVYGKCMAGGACPSTARYQ